MNCALAQSHLAQHSDTKNDQMAFVLDILLRPPLIQGHKQAAYLGYSLTLP